MKSFKKGNDKSFFASWQKLVNRKKLANPEWVPSSEVEFKVRAFLTIFHLNPHSGSKVSYYSFKVTDEDVILVETLRRIEDFKGYLNTHATEFMDNEAFSNYFNIPFILNIEGDRQEEFRDFFEQSWTESVTSELSAILEEMTQETEGQEETEHQTGTQLEQMIKFYIKHNSTGGHTEANPRWEQIEMKAEEASAGIEKQKQANKKKMAEISHLAHKYEGLKVEYESYLGQLDDKLKTETTYLPGSLFVENKVRQKAIEEREKHEAEIMKITQKDLAKKFNVQEIRLFRNQYKERFGNYKLLTFNASKSNIQLKDAERLWRRILFEYSYAAFSYAKAVSGGEDAPVPQEAGPTANKKDGQKDPPKKVPAKPAVKTVSKEDLEKKQKRMTSLDKDFTQIRHHMNSDPDTLKKFMTQIGAVDTPAYDKKYKLEESYIQSCILVTKEDIIKSKATPDHTKDPKTVAGKDKTKDDKDGDKPKADPKTDGKDDGEVTKNDETKEHVDTEYNEDIRERTCISLSVLNQKLALIKEYNVPNEELFLEQICLNLDYMIKKLIEKKVNIKPTLTKELELSFVFLLRMAQQKATSRERLRRHNFTSNLFMEMYSYIENNAKQLAESKRLVLYTQQILKLSRLILESYREQVTLLPKTFENFVQLYSSKANFETPPKSVQEIDWVLISCVAMSSKQAGDLFELERETLARIIVEENYRQYPETIPKVVELSVESSLVVLAALGKHQRVGQFKGVKDLLAHLESHPTFAKNKVLE
jgi:hypothetical protein